MGTMNSVHAWLYHRPVGTFAADSRGRIVFEYESSYSGPPLSVSMPVGGTWTARTPAAFLDGLLPDSKASRLALARTASTTVDDVMGMLADTDITGAVRLSHNDHEPIPADGVLTIVDDDMIAMRIDSIKNELPRGGSDGERFSLAGSQSKFALTRLEDRWFKPNGVVPSTHIFKPESPRTADAEVIENATMALADRIGIPAPRSSVMRFDDASSYVVERFDRSCESGGIERIHQEDFMQALGRVDRQGRSKYSVDSRDVIAMLRTLNPELPYDWTKRLAFNIAVGNVDAHAKNYGVMIPEDSSFALAPEYDALTTVYWDFVDKRPPFAIGGQRGYAMTSEKNWLAFARRNAMDADRVLSIVGEVNDKVMASIAGVYDDLHVDATIRDRVLGIIDVIHATAPSASPGSIGRSRPALPRGARGHSTVHVHEYERADGVIVHEHERRAPGAP